MKYATSTMQQVCLHFNRLSPSRLSRSQSLRPACRRCANGSYCTAVPPSGLLPAGLLHVTHHPPTLQTARPPASPEGHLAQCRHNSPANVTLSLHKSILTASATQGSVCSTERGSRFCPGLRRLSLSAGTTRSVNCPGSNEQTLTPRLPASPRTS